MQSRFCCQGFGSSSFRSRSSRHRPDLAVRLKRFRISTQAAQLCLACICLSFLQAVRWQSWAPPTSSSRCLHRLRIPPISIPVVPAGSALAIKATSHLLIRMAVEADGRLNARLAPAAQRGWPSVHCKAAEKSDGPHPQNSPLPAFLACRQQKRATVHILKTYPCLPFLPAGSALAVIATSHLLTKLAAEADGCLIAGLTPAAQRVLAASALHILQERLDNAAAAVALADGHLGQDGEAGDSMHGSPMHAPETPWQLIGNGLVMRELPVGHDTLEVTGTEAGSQEAAPASEGPEKAATAREGTQNCRHIELQTGTLLQKHLSMPLAPAPAH